MDGSSDHSLAWIVSNEPSTTQTTPLADARRSVVVVAPSARVNGSLSRTLTSKPAVPPALSGQNVPKCGRSA